MNVERQHCILVVLWFDSIHIGLWRNDGFLHFFRDFSKSNAISKNFKNEVYLLLNFLSNEYTSEQQNLEVVLQFIFKNDAPKFSAYNNYYCYDTGRSFEPIFMKFRWLVRVHTWVDPIVFGSKWPNRTTDMGEIVPQNRDGHFWGKNFETIFNTPFPVEKVLSIFVIRCSLCPKNYFSHLFWKILFFLRKIVQWKIFKTSFPSKKVILILVTRCTLSPKTVMFSHKWFFSIFST